MRSRIVILAVVCGVFALVLARAPRRDPGPVMLGSFGHGSPIVLVHGLGSGAEHWLPVARDLARDHRVVFVELPGHGVGQMPGHLTLEGAAAGLDRAIAGECREPVVLVGHSVGGLVATAEALRSPSRVRALVLVETALKPQLANPDRAALFAALDRDYRGTLRENYESFGRDSAQGEALFAGAAALDSVAMKAWIHLAVTADLSDRVGELKVPLLVVLSDRSWPPGELWASCADTLGYTMAHSATRVRVAGCGHFVMLDRPLVVADLIRRFEHVAAPNAVAVAAR
jgi:pimeloyl-ACP methyl ester carboxylesterase